MASVNIVKRVKIGNRWKFFAIPRNEKGTPNWKALPEGRYYLEWYLAGTLPRALVLSSTADVCPYSSKHRKARANVPRGAPDSSPLV